jgi:transcriptional regulator with GAF, ATPase, and Fis domain
MPAAVSSQPMIAGDDGEEDKTDPRPQAQTIHTVRQLIETVAVPRLSLAVEREGGMPVQRTIVHEGDICRIGSHPSNDLVLSDPTISRFHCRLTLEGNAWRILDSGSTNGTRIDGVKVLTAELEREVVISIGDSRVRVKPDGHAREVSVAVVPSFGGLVGTSAAMQRLFDLLDRVAASDIDVLIQGESGTGKELVATEIVQRSPRAQGPLVVVDCGSISPSLVESELFGHVRGAFTGAERDREGAFEAADGGTVFLDEIGELPLELQPKLLRALEAREVRRVGQTKSKKVDVRVVAATHRDLEREVNRGRFREDLYYRLAKVSVRVPPLRDRLEDLPLLVKTFLAAMGDNGIDKFFDRLFSPGVLAEMQEYDWPGNVRELRNFVERSTVLDDVPPPRRSGTMPAVRPNEVGDLSGAAAAPTGTRPPVDRSLPFRIAKERAIESFERAYIGPLLDECQGNMSKAARTARMDRMYLHQLAQKHGLRGGRSQPPGSGEHRINVSPLGSGSGGPPSGQR